MTDHDYTIVGTGPAAYFLCLSIFNNNPNSKIKIYEAGATKNLINTDDFSYQQVEQNFNLNPTTYIGYGGTSNLWHNVIAPLDSEDFEVRDWIKNSGWPISMNDISGYYKKVARYLNFDYELFNGHRFDKNLEIEREKVSFDEEIFENKYFLQLKKPFRTKSHFQKLQKKYNLKILQNHRVLKILANSESDKVQSVSIGIGGKKITQNVKNLILCCGALETARILLNSETLKSLSSKAGKNFLDHPMGNTFQMKYPTKRTTRLYSDLNYSPQLKIKSALKLTLRAQEKFRLPNHSFYLRPSFSEGIDNSTEKVKLKLLAIREKLLKYQIPFSESFAILSNLNLARQIIQYKTGLSSGHRLADFMFVTEQIPNDKSEIYLSNDLDKYGLKKLKVRWNITDRDLKSISEFYDICYEHLCQNNRAKYTIKKEQLNWSSRLSSAAHHLGTARMGEYSNSSVVNKFNQVHGISNLYINDGSIFPTAGNANSTFTIMALSMRLGDYLEKN